MTLLYIGRLQTNFINSLSSAIRSAMLSGTYDTSKFSDVLRSKIALEYEIMTGNYETTMKIFGVELVVYGVNMNGVGVKASALTIFTKDDVVKTPNYNFDSKATAMLDELYASGAFADIISVNKVTTTNPPHSNAFERVIINFD